MDLYLHLKCLILSYFPLLQTGKFTMHSYVVACCKLCNLIPKWPLSSNCQFCVWVPGHHPSIIDSPCDWQLGHLSFLRCCESRSLSYRGTSWVWGMLFYVHVRIADLDFLWHICPPPRPATLFSYMLDHWSVSPHILVNKLVSAGTYEGPK